VAPAPYAREITSRPCPVEKGDSDIGAWQTLVASDLAASPHRLVVELSYATITSRAHLERAVAADAKTAAAFLRRARNEGALVTTRGAAGPLAGKLRQRLPVDLTVEA